MKVDLWLGCCAQGARHDLMRALRSVRPHASLAFVSSPMELRESFLWEEPGTVGAIIGLSERGISDENLAAAIARDGRAAEVILVTREARGSVRSRMALAGVSQVIEVARGGQDAAASLGSRLPAVEDFRRQEDPALTAVPAPVRQGEELAACAERECHVQASATKNAGPGCRSQAREMPQGGPRDGQAADASEAGPAAASAAPSRPDLSYQGHLGAGAVISVVSGRGGVGKTALVALGACIAAGWGMKVAALDLDLSCGNLFTCFGLGRGSDLSQLGERPVPDAIGRAGAQAAPGVSLWGPCELPEMAETVMPAVRDLVNYAAARFDLVLVDTSTTFTDAVAQAVQLSDRICVVSDERTGGFSSAARTSSLVARLGVARTRIIRIANLCDPKGRPDKFISRGEAGLEGARSYNVLDGDLEAEELLASGHAADLAHEESDFSDSLGACLAKTLSDLGKLPDDEGARRAAAAEGKRRRTGFFSRRKEAS